MMTCDVTSKEATGVSACAHSSGWSKIAQGVAVNAHAVGTPIASQLKKVCVRALIWAAGALGANGTQSRFLNATLPALN